MTQIRKSVLLFVAVSALAADYQAGVGVVDITPDGPIWLSGYASRQKPSDGVLQRIAAKAIAIEDSKGGRVVIVTTDLIGLPRTITDLVGARLAKEHGLARERVLFNSSHTHTGPVVRPNLSVMYDLDAENDRRVGEYTRVLSEKLFTVVAAALGDLKPASLAFASGQVGFASNRRLKGPDGVVRNAQNPAGVVDHSVHMLKVTDAKGNVRAVLFGYACHNTTLTGEHHKISGDYAGVAQAAVERAMPGTTALFLELCGGDQNPYPRGKEENVEQHGGTLAAEVRRLLAEAKPVKGRTGAALQWRDLPLQPHDRSDFEKMLTADDPIRVRFAKLHLAAYDARRPQRSVPFPVQALRIGNDVAIVALGGEPVVEYALGLKARNPKLRLVVAGYSNDVMGYLPTAKMLDEGGYEPISSGMYYGLAMPFTKDVERSVHETMDQVLRRAMR